jgi:adenine/guanine phosphoribosyltransferase-like PRPP-binding protein
MLPESFWQEILPPGSIVSGGYAARFDDGRILALPLRPLEDGRHALASLIINQASFAVVDALAQSLARKLSAFDPEVVVGMPTLGLTLASAVAGALGHSRYVPLGNSAKFWYDEALSVPLSSVTTPVRRRLFLDPRMLPVLKGRRVVLLDDVISSGASMCAGLALMRLCDVTPVALGTAMLQSDRWRGPLAGWDLVSVLQSPILPLG